MRAPCAPASGAQYAGRSDAHRHKQSKLRHDLVLASDVFETNLPRLLVKPLRYQWVQPAGHFLPMGQCWLLARHNRRQRGARVWGTRQASGHTFRPRSTRRAVGELQGPTLDFVRAAMARQREEFERSLREHLRSCAAKAEGSTVGAGHTGGHGRVH